MKNLVHVVFMISLILGISIDGMADDKTYIGSGNWDDALKWNPSGVPNNSDNVIIPNGSEVTFNRVTNDEVVKNITIKTGGTLRIATPANYFKTAGSLKVEKNGSLYSCCSLEIGDKSGAVSLNGTLKITGESTTLWCNPLIVNCGATFTTEGKVDVGNHSGKLLINGDDSEAVTTVSIGGELRCNPMTVGPNTVVTCYGDVNIGNQSGVLNLNGGVVDMKGVVIFGSVSVDGDGGDNWTFDADQIYKTAFDNWGHSEAVKHLQSVGILGTTPSWLGKTTDWFDNNNWSDSKVPTAKSIVNITKNNGNKTCNPVIVGGIAEVLSISLDDEYSLSVGNFESLPSFNIDCESGVNDKVFIRNNGNNVYPDFEVGKGKDGSGISFNVSEWSTIMFIKLPAENLNSSDKISFKFDIKRSTGTAWSVPANVYNSSFGAEKSINNGFNIGDSWMTFSYTGDVGERAAYVGISLQPGEYFIDNISMGLGDGSKVGSGSLNVMGSILVNNSNSRSDNAVVLNHKYDEMSSLRVGDAIYGVNNKIKTIYSNVKVNRTLKTGVAYYLSSATKEGSVMWNDGVGESHGIASYNPVNEEYDATVGGFTAPYLGSNLIVRGSSSDRTISQIGTLQNSNEPVSVECKTFIAEGKEYYGWNLIANPYSYPFPLNNGSQFTRNGAEFVVFRAPNSQGQYQQYVYSFVTDVTLPNDDFVDEPSLRCLAPQQAFFVKTNVDQENKSFGFNPSSVAINAVSLSDNRLRTKKVKNDVLYISLVTNVATRAEDQSAMVFRSGGTIGVNPVDADKKMEGKNYNQLYLLKDDAEYAIGLYPTVSEVSDVELRIGMIPAQGATEMTLKAINLDEFDASTDVYLIDKENNDKSYNLRETESVTFPVVKSGTAINDRFAIVLKTNKSLEVDDEDEGDEVATEISAVENDDNVVICRLDENNAVVKVSEVKENMTAKVYDIAGRKLVTKVIKSGEEVISLGAGKGLYVVTVNEGNWTKAAVKISK